MTDIVMDNNMQTVADPVDNNDEPDILPLMSKRCPLREHKDAELYVIRKKDNPYWSFKKLHDSLMWTADDIVWSEDVKSFSTLTPEQQHPIKTALAFFASADGVVLENLAERFTRDVKVSEIRAFYTAQMYIEGIHGETYSDAIQALIPAEEREYYFNAIKTIPSVRKMTLWAQKWIKSDAPFIVRLLAFAMVEGILFSGAFCIIFWMKHVLKVPCHGLYNSNELISRDEGLHTEFAVFFGNDIFEKCQERLSVEILYSMMSELMECLEEFTIDALRVDLLGMNKNLMIQYLRFVGNRFTTSLGYEPMYENHAENLFDWMKSIGMPDKFNFFERKPTYSKHNSVNGAASKISLTDKIVLNDDDDDF